MEWRERKGKGSDGEASEGRGKEGRKGGKARKWRVGDGFSFICFGRLVVSRNLAAMNTQHFYLQCADWSTKVIAK